MDLIAGRWADPERPDGVIENRSPADLGAALGRHPWAVVHAEAAVAAAQRAQPAWAARPLYERLALVRNVGHSLKRREDELARAIALDMGKALWDARTEVAAAVNKAAVTADEGMRLVAGFLPGSPAGAAESAGHWAGALAAQPGPLECRFKPLGVLAVFGPFNFPVHLPNGHVLPALACGNAVVMKPSEVAPHAAELYARCVVEAGVPAGVFNLVQGGPPVGQALAAHPAVDGVLFTGSWSVGQAISRAAQGQTKLLALELGGKNAQLVLTDADEDKALYDALFSAFVSAGQRCTASSRLIVEGPPARADAFAARLARLAQKLVVGHPLDEGVFMGPLASEAALSKFEQGLQGARVGGVEEVLASRRLSPRGLSGCYATPAVHRVRKRSGSAYEREELFGPDLAVYSAGSADEAIAIANDTDYGLAASVHTKSAAAFEHCAAQLQAGCINWNAPTVGASGKLPFGGVRRSGNHRPAGLFSTLYCAAPVAILRGEPGLDLGKLAPGVTWDAP
jgi:succinylglutamic semialdehyde dehydrogenase